MIICEVRLAILCLSSFYGSIEVSLELQQEYNIATKTTIVYNKMAHTQIFLSFFLEFCLILRIFTACGRYQLDMYKAYFRYMPNYKMISAILYRMLTAIKCFKSLSSPNIACRSKYVNI